jgi:hypothetical protein
VSVAAFTLKLRSRGVSQDDRPKADALPGDHSSATCCPFRKFNPAWIRIVRQTQHTIEGDVAILRVLGKLVAGLFKSRCRVEAENLFLRHQLTIASRQAKVSSSIAWH